MTSNLTHARSVVRFAPLPLWEPLGEHRSIYGYLIAGRPLYAHALERAAELFDGTLCIVVDDSMLAQDGQALDEIGSYGRVILPPNLDDDHLALSPAFPMLDGCWLELRYPWHLLDVMSDVLQGLEQRIEADVDIEPGVEFSGKVVLETGVKVMGGARFKGNIYVGPDSIIGNSALLRGDVSIGPNSLVGLCGEVKNSLLLGHALVGPMTTVHETIAEEDCFFGGTTRISNYRLDGNNVEVLIGGELVDTGRKQFGTILAAGVKFGGACLILPGRKIGARCEIGPHVVVSQNLSPRKRVMLRQDLDIRDL